MQQEEQLRKHKGQNLCDVLCFPAIQTYGTLNSTLYTVHADLVLFQDRARETSTKTRV